MLEWDFTITTQVIRDWLHCTYTAGSEILACSDGDCVDGWIPREMILGQEATKRVPEEFITQRTNVANPPTLLLAINALMDKLAAVTDQKLADQSSILIKTHIVEFLQEIYPKLHIWVQWLLHSQSSSFETDNQSPSSPNVFRWKGRSLRDSKVN